MAELESEGKKTRSEVAVFLREFANELDDTLGPQGERREGVVTEETPEAKPITFIVGDESATVTVPNTVDFDVEVESRSPMLSHHVNQEIELEISWEIENPEETSGDRIEVR